MDNLKKAWAITKLASGSSPSEAKKLLSEKFGLGLRAAKNLVEAALAELGDDIAEEHRARARAHLYGMSLEVFKKAMRQSQLSAANKSVENIARLTGAFEAERRETVVTRGTVSQAVEEMSEDELERFIESEIEK